MTPNEKTEILAEADKFRANIAGDILAILSKNGEKPSDEVVNLLNAGLKNCIVPVDENGKDIV